MCHALLQDIKFFELLLLIDQELARQVRATGCPCGGPLHRANYPRKPRACLKAIRSSYETRFSFCCRVCRKRLTSASVRFLGRRVYLGLAVVLMSARRAGPTSCLNRVAQGLGLPVRTLLRWHHWWRDQFPKSRFWQANCGRFMPSLGVTVLAASLLEHFSGTTELQLHRLLFFLSPITVGHPLTLREGH